MEAQPKQRKVKIEPILHKCPGCGRKKAYCKPEGWLEVIDFCPRCGYKEYL